MNLKPNILKFHLKPIYHCLGNVWVGKYNMPSNVLMGKWYDQFPSRDVDDRPTKWISINGVGPIQNTKPNHELGGPPHWSSAQEYKFELTSRTPQFW